MVEMSHQSIQRDAGQTARIVRTLVLLAIIVLASVFRFTGLNWDEGQYIHPDEGHMRNTLSLIRWPEDLSLYFDTHHAPLNVRNREGRRYSYGTLPLFAARAATEWLDGACTNDPAPLREAVATMLVGPEIENCTPGTFTGAYNAVVGRTLSALADLGTLLFIYLIGRRLYGAATGLVAAGFGAVTAFMIQQAHFFTVDSMACFFVTLVAYFSIRAARAGEDGAGAVGARSESKARPGESGLRVRWLDFALAGVSVGLAAACKVSAATAALLVVLAAAQVALGRRREQAQEEGEATRRSLGSAQLLMPLLALTLAGVLSLVAFRVGQPYAFEGPGFFGVKPSPEWFSRLRQIRLEQAGEVDLPSGRQWADRLPIVFPWLNMVVWGMGLPLGLAGWIGWGVAGFELFAGKGRGRRHLVLWAWFTVLFLYQATQWVKSMRYFLPLYPVLLLFAAFWLVRLVRSGSIWARRAGLGLSGLIALGAVFWGLAFFTIYVRPHTRVAASRWIYENVPRGATVANEHWDWGLPLRLDGHDPFGGLYSGIEMEHYNEDTPQKRHQLYRWLDESDWIFLASNRLYASIPRIPARYPLTTAYYEALFAGELGFELDADFTSYPALGPFVFPDQENPFPLMEPDHQSQQRPITVNLPPAEEGFSVYDHPRVLIFRKTETYSSQKVRDVLGAVDLEWVEVGRTPQQATRAPNLLRFDEQVWAEQRAGGTWSAMFHRDGLLNRYPGLAALAWWLIVTALGWLAFPLLFVALPSLGDRGYGFARLFALLLIAYLTWLAGSLHLFPNSRSTIIRMVSLLALVGLGVGWLRWRDLRAYLLRRWRVLLAIEGLFALLFVTWIGVRMLQPDLWHPVVGGEKPMDFAYLNAVMKSTWFPPYNPWLSGTWINYYYFGFVIVGTLIKLVGTVPAIAYNLAVPLLFALTGVGAFSVAYNLSGGQRRRRLRVALATGLAAVVFTLLLGNLGVVHLLHQKLIIVGDVSFPSTIPGLPNAVSLVRGVWRVMVERGDLTVRPETWYWHPTRIIPAETGNPIAEFPAFTFLYGDLHAHMIAFPLTLFALALAWSWARGRGQTLGSLLIGGLVIGALRPTNTWDYPTYLLFGILGLGLGAWSLSKRGPERDGSGDLSLAGRLAAVGRRLAWQVPTLVALTVVLYLPYIRHYVVGYSSVELWKGEGTPVRIYLWIYGGLLFPVVTWLVAGLMRLGREGRIPSEGLPTLAGLMIGGVCVLGVVLWLLEVEVALVAVPIMALATLAFCVPGRVDVENADGREVPAGLGRRHLLWLMVAAAMALSLTVEIVVLKGDIGRMNTVFKFYLQVWILLAISAAVSVVRIWRQTDGWDVPWGELWRGLMVLLILGGLLFLPLGVRARAGDRMVPEAGLTLNGMAFMEDAVIHDGREEALVEISLTGDYHAIHWMQENVEGTPVILEGLGRREYLWANRVSVHTGLPTVVGWRWHQVQQRSGVGGDIVNRRRDDVNLCYSTTSTAEAADILERYNVRYVYVGAYERAYYDAAGLDKFSQMAAQGQLRVVYEVQDVVLYEVLL